MTENLIYAAAALTFGIGYLWGKRDYCNNLAFWKSRAADWSDSQNRLADALEAKSERLERIIEQETPGANATVKRMAAIARGEA